jgi:AcrR family transcriptional regulator
MNGFEKRREQKKEGILAAARKLFFEKGFKETSVEKIAKLAQVSPVSVYNFYNTKKNLYVRTIEAAFYESMDVYDEILNSEKSFYEKLFEFILYKISSREKIHPDYFKPEDLIDPEICAVIADVKEKRILPFFEKLIEQGKKEGTINGSIDTESVMLYINIFSSGLTDPQLVKTISDNKKLSEDIGNLFLFGFGGTFADIHRRTDKNRQIRFTVDKHIDERTVKADCF